jgi:hypothetical protein
VRKRLLNLQAVDFSFFATVRIVAVLHWQSANCRCWPLAATQLFAKDGAIMWQILAPVFVGLSLFAGISASASNPSQAIAPGGCILEDVVRGKLFQDMVEDNDWDNQADPFQPRLPIAKVKFVWKVASGGRTYQLDFGRNKEWQTLAAKLAGRNVVVTGFLTGDALVVTGLKADGQVAVQVTGKPRLDLTEILRPYQVCWYIDAGRQHFYLDFAGNKELEKLAATATGGVIAAGELEVNGRWQIVHVHSLKPAENKTGEVLEERVYQGSSARYWRTEATILAVKGGDHRPLIEHVRALLGDDLKAAGQSVRVEGGKLVVRTTAANHARIQKFLDMLMIIPGPGL